MNKSSATPLLEVKDVAARYGEVKAIKGISFHVNRGEIVTLIGANGAGKSTTLRVVSGQLVPSQGRVLYKGERIDGIPAHEVAGLGIGHVPEGRRIFPHLSVEENLDVGAYLQTDKNEISVRKAEVYELFPRLAERKKQDGGTLSGGEQQMLAIGRALMQDPELLLLDEPTLGLAPILVEKIFETIDRLYQAGKTILLVEQNAWHALKIAHRGYVLQTGTVTLEGEAKELLNNEGVQASYLGV